MTSRLENAKMEKKNWRKTVAEHDCGPAVVGRIEELEADMLALLRELGNYELIGSLDSGRSLKRLAEMTAALDTLGEMVLDCLQCAGGNARTDDAKGRTENDRAPDGSNGMGFLDTLERDLANAIEHAGSCQLTEDEDGAELLGALASAWKNLRYARRELDVTFWDKYRRTGDPPSHDHDFDTSDNQAQGAAQ